MANWAVEFLEQSELSKYPSHPVRNGLIFSGPGSQRTAVLQVQPTHYLDGGEYKPIDTALRTQPGGSYGAPGLSPSIFRSGQVEFPSGYTHMTRGIGILNAADHSYAELVAFDQGTAQANKIIRHQGIYSQEIILSEKRLKEQVILQEKPGNLAAGWFVIETEILDKDFPISSFKQGLTYRNIGFDAGLAWDSNDDLINVTQFAVEKSGGTSVLYSGVPVDWLEHAVYPVTIDPTFTSQPDSSGKDTYLSEPNASTNYGSLNKMIFGSNGSSPGNDFAGLLQFDLTSLPPCSVDDATLTVTKQGDTADSSLVVTLQRILVDWLENQACWNDRVSGSPWNTAGCLSTSDREDTALGTITYQPDDPNNIQKNISLNPSRIQEWINGTLNNNGFRFGYNGDVTSNAYYAIYSSDEATPSYRPKLEINYSLQKNSFSVPAMLIG
jgi:hypothetical protein